MKNKNILIIYKLEHIFDKYVSVTKDYIDSIAEIIVGFLVFAITIYLKGQVVAVSGNSSLNVTNDLFVYSDLHFCYENEEEVFLKSILHARKLIKQDTIVNNYCSKYNHKLTNFEKNFISEFTINNLSKNFSYEKKIFYNELLNHISFYRIT